jgi:membrane protease YdiL (CAAX protease family)
MKETSSNHVPWGWLTAIGLPIAHMVIQIALGLVVVSLLSVVLLATSNFNQDTLLQFATSGLVTGIIGALGGVMSLALIYAVVTRLRKRPFRATIGLVGNGRIWPAAFGAVILGGVMDTVTLALHKPIVPDTLQPLFTGASSAVAMAAFAVIVTPFVEELLFRGVLFPVVARSLNTFWAVILVSVLFGLAHMATYGLDPYSIMQSLVAGLYLTWLRARTKSLPPSIAAHAALNLYATVEAIVVMNVLK